MSQVLVKALNDYVRDFEDFPQQGILFKDLLPLYASVEARAQLREYLLEHYDPKQFDVIVGIDARGFVLATLMAECWQKRLVLVRKAGKLPGPTYQESYHLEYGFATLEVQQDAFLENERAFLVDDLLAMGGTLAAASKVVEEAGANIFKIFTLLELGDLNGREHLKPYDIDSLIVY